MIEEKAYAKVNLTLEVGNKNEDGFHEIKTIMVPIDLYDVLTFEKTNTGIVLLDNTDINQENNIVYKAAKLIFDKYDLKGGVLITLKKFIPQEAGLAGGSSDCAACLRGLNRLFDLNLSLDDLAEMSKSLGSDIAYCVYSKPSLCQGRGTDVKLLNLKMPEWNILLIKPPFGCSTKEIYNRYVSLDKSHEENHEKVIEGIKTENLEMVNTYIFNDLEAPAFLLNSNLKKLSDNVNFKRKALMSGSGSTIYVISKDKKELETIVKENSEYLTYIITKFINL